MTWMQRPGSGPVPASVPGTTGLGRGERETRGEHRGRGERLPSGSRFVFPVAVFLALLPAFGSPPAAAQDRPGGFDLGLRLSGVIATRLIADAIGGSVLPDTLLEDRFSRDTVEVRTPVAPDLTLVAGLPLGPAFALELAAGFTFAELEVSEPSSTRSGGSVLIGHAVFSARKPVRGFETRLGAGALWFQGGEMSAIEGMRALNPLLEIAAARRWQRAGFDLDAGLAAQAAQISSTALEARQSPPGLFYRLGIELGVSRSIGR